MRKSSLEPSDYFLRQELQLPHLLIKYPFYEVGSGLVQSGHVVDVYKRQSVNQLRQRRQVVLNYFDDMGVEISEASQDGPYLFQACLLYTSIMFHLISMSLRKNWYLKNKNLKEKITWLKLD